MAAAGLRTNRHICSDWRHLAAVVLAPAVLLLLLSRSEAQVTVQPTVIEVSAASGGRGRLSFTLVNRARWAYQVTTTVVDLDVAPNGFPSAAPALRERGASSWIALNPKSFSLAPGQGLKINGEVRPPRGAVGTYSAMITWELSGRPGETGTSRIHMNAVVLVSTGGRSAKPVISVKSVDLMPGGKGQGEGNWQVRVPVSNSGQLHGRVSGAVIIRRVGGGTVATVPVVSGMGLVLPGATRDLVGLIPGGLRDGAYLAVAKAQAEGTRVEARHVGFFLVKNGTVQAQPPDEKALKELAALLPPLSSDRAIARESLAPGARRLIRLQMANNTSAPLTVQLSVTAAPGEAANKDSLPRAVPSERLRPGWFSVSPQVDRVEAGRVRSLNVTAALPRDARGEYYAYLLLAPGRGGTSPDLPASAVLVAVTAKGTAEAALEAKSVSVRSVKGGGVDYAVVVLNTGNIAVTAAGKVTLLSSNGKEMETKALPADSLLMPSASATLKAVSDRPLRSGAYRVRVSLALEDGRVITEERAVSVP